MAHALSCLSYLPHSMLVFTLISFDSDLNAASSILVPAVFVMCKNLSLLQEELGNTGSPEELDIIDEVDLVQI